MLGTEKKKDATEISGVMAFTEVRLTLPSYESPSIHRPKLTPDVNVFSFVVRMASQPPFPSLIRCCSEAENKSIFGPSAFLFRPAETIAFQKRLRLKLPNPVNAMGHKLYEGRKENSFSCPTFGRSG